LRKPSPTVKLKKKDNNPVLLVAQLTRRLLKTKNQPAKFHQMKIAKNTWEKLALSVTRNIILKQGLVWKVIISITVWNGLLKPNALNARGVRLSLQID